MFDNHHGIGSIYRAITIDVTHLTIGDITCLAAVALGLVGAVGVLDEPGFVVHVAGRHLEVESKLVTLLHAVEEPTLELISLTGGSPKFHPCTSLGFGSVVAVERTAARLIGREIHTVGVGHLWLRGVDGRKVVDGYKVYVAVGHDILELLLLAILLAIERPVVEGEVRALRRGAYRHLSATEIGATARGISALGAHADPKAQIGLGRITRVEIVLRRHREHGAAHNEQQPCHQYSL